MICVQFTQLFYSIQCNTHELSVAKGHSSANMDGGGMGLALHLRSDQAAEESKFDDMKALQEAPIQVEFILPDDSTVSHEFKKGQTVQVLKCFLETEYELSQSDTQLFFRDKLMLEPFSLTDFDGIESAHVMHVSVRRTASRK